MTISSKIAIFCSEYENWDVFYISKFTPLVQLSTK